MVAALNDAEPTQPRSHAADALYAEAGRSMLHSYHTTYADRGYHFQDTLPESAVHDVAGRPVRLAITRYADLTRSRPNSA